MKPNAEKCYSCEYHLRVGHYCFLCLEMELQKLEETFMLRKAMLPQLKIIYLAVR